MDTVTRIIRSVSISEPTAGVLKAFQSQVTTALISGNKHAQAPAALSDITAESNGIT